MKQIVISILLSSNCSYVTPNKDSIYVINDKIQKELQYIWNEHPLPNIKTPEIVLIKTKLVK